MLWITFIPCAMRIKPYESHELQTLGQYGRQQGAAERTRHTWAPPLASPLPTRLGGTGQVHHSFPLGFIFLLIITSDFSHIALKLCFFNRVWQAAKDTDSNYIVSHLTPTMVIRSALSSADLQVFEVNKDGTWDNHTEPSFLADLGGEGGRITLTMIYWGEKYHWKLKLTPTDKGFKETWCDPYIGWPYPNWSGFEKRCIINNPAETAGVTQAGLQPFLPLTKFLPRKSRGQKG